MARTYIGYPTLEAWALIRSWLEEQGFSVREGVIAHPKELKLFEGWPGFLRYDKEQKRYRRVLRGGSGSPGSP